MVLSIAFLQAVTKVTRTDGMSFMAWLEPLGIGVRIFIRNGVSVIIILLALVKKKNFYKKRKRRKKKLPHYFKKKGNLMVKLEPLFFGSFFLKFFLFAQASSMIITET